MEVSPAIYLISPDLSKAPSLNYHLSLEERLESFKDYLEKDDCKVNGAWPPDLVRVFEIWENYVDLPNENIAMYDRIKALFSSLWGDWYFYQILNDTYFFHQTRWLRTQGILKDVDYPE